MKHQDIEDNDPIDLTPMLDVVFIMLIFFVVTATFVREAGVEVNRPKATTTEKHDNTTILIAIDMSNNIWIDKQQVDIRSVKAHIERLHIENPDSGLIIQADELATIKHFTAVLDAAREVVPHEKIFLSATE